MPRCWSSPGAKSMSRRCSAPCGRNERRRNERRPGDVMERKPIIAIPVGDPAGIGPEISLKAALDPGVRAIARPILVGDPAIIARHAEACRIAADLLVRDELDSADWPDTRLALLACRSNE